MPTPRSAPADAQGPLAGDYRGEYTTPDGHRIEVAVRAEDQHLAAVRLTVAPSEQDPGQPAGHVAQQPAAHLAEQHTAQLRPLAEQTLTGMPADSSVHAMRAALEGALREHPGARNAGDLLEGMGIAVRRAVGRASSWPDHTFEVIHEEVPRDPALHLALDQVLPDEVAAGRRGPVFRIWEWDAPVIVLGSFQSVRNEIDPEGLARQGMRVLRRVSGGGAMFMIPQNCVTYSLVVPTSLVEGLSFEQSYRYLDDWVLHALREVGVDARYRPLNDIASARGKIGGAAQKRFAKGVVLHHVTCAYAMDSSAMLDVLRIGREQLTERGTRSANKRVDPMRSQTSMTRAEIIASFLGTFRNRYATRPSQYTEAELAAAEELVLTKFSTEKWTYKMP